MEGASLQSSITITRLITHVITQSCYYNYDRHTHKATHLASTSAPLSIRKSATSIFPWRAARCRGVLPFSSSSVRVEGCLWTKTRTTLNKIWKKEEVRGSWIIANALCSHIADTYMHSTVILTVKARVKVSQHKGHRSTRMWNNGNTTRSSIHYLYMLRLTFKNGLMLLGSSGGAHGRAEG